MRFFKEADPVKTAQYMVTLASKLTEWGLPYQFGIEPTGTSTDDVAQMRPNNSFGDDRPLIFMGYEMSRFDNLYAPIVLMHEMGHFLDYRACNCISWNYYKKYGTLEIEIMAWENAFLIARQVGFTNYEAIEDIARQCLSTYFDFNDVRGYLENDRVVNWSGKKPTRKEGMDRLKAARVKAERAYANALIGV